MTIRSRSSSIGDRIARYALATVAIAATVLFFRQDNPIRIRADDTFNEVLVPALSSKRLNGTEPVIAEQETPEALPAPLQPIPESLAPPSATCDCQKGKSNDSPSIYVSAFGGGSYFDTAPDVSLGGLYGGYLSARLADRLGVMALGQINSYSGGTEYAGTVGGYLNTKYYGEAWERFGGTIAFDQLTDSGLGNPYLSQGRLIGTYRLLPGASVSVQYTDPLTSSSNIVVPGFGPTPFRGFHTTQGLLQVGTTTLGVGYVEEERSMTYTFAKTQTVTERLSLMMNASYDGNINLWTAFVGVNLQLTRPTRTAWLIGRSNKGGIGDIVRGEISLLSSALTGAWDPALADSGHGDQMFDDLARQELAIQALQQLDARARQAGSRGGGSTCNCPVGFKDNGLSGSGAGRIRLCLNPSNNRTTSIPCPE